MCATHSGASVPRSKVSMLKSAVRPSARLQCLAAMMKIPPLVYLRLLDRSASRLDLRRGCCESVLLVRLRERRGAAGGAGGAAGAIVRERFERGAAASCTLRFVDFFRFWPRATLASGSWSASPCPVSSTSMALGAVPSGGDGEGFSINSPVSRSIRLNGIKASWPSRSV